jgi:hypothetical protein
VSILQGRRASTPRLLASWFEQRIDNEARLPQSADRASKRHNLETICKIQGVWWNKGEYA